MRYFLLILLFPAIIYADPRLIAQDNTCHAYTADQIPEFEISGCWFTQQNGAATLWTKKVYLEDRFSGFPIDPGGSQTYKTTNADAPGIMCYFTDDEGNPHYSSRWETELTIRKHSYLTAIGKYKVAVYYNMYCHRDESLASGAGPLINLNNDSCRGFMGDVGPDFEGNRCYFNDDGTRAKWGHFLFHKYMHIDDTIPSVNKGETITVKATSSDYPGVPCRITKEDGTSTLSYQWESITEIRSQYTPNEREAVDRVLLDISCTPGPV